MAKECFLVAGKTCCYGIVMERSRCDVDNTYANLHRAEYDAYVVVCAVVGIATFLACVHKLYSVHQSKGTATKRYCQSPAHPSDVVVVDEGSPIQKQVYYLLVLASVTFIARAVDPMSRMHRVPLQRLVRASSAFLGYLMPNANACFGGGRILSVAFWARIVIRPTDLVRAEIPIRASTALGLFLTWFVFACVRPLYLLPAWGDTLRIFRSWHILIQYSMAPFLLFLVSTLAVIFGVRIHRRLKSIRETNER
ncbi:hypothetical protein AaE_000241, partial [Aphanomyces astaci]